MVHGQENIKKPSKMLRSHLRLGLPNGLFPSGFPHQNPVYASPLPHSRYMPRPSHSSWFCHPNNIGWAVHSTHVICMLYCPCWKSGGVFRVVWRKDKLPESLLQRGATLFYSLWTSQGCQIASRNRAKGVWSSREKLKITKGAVVISNIRQVFWKVSKRIDFIRNRTKTTKNFTWRPGRVNEIQILKRKNYLLGMYVCQ